MKPIITKSRFRKAVLKEANSNNNCTINITCIDQILDQFSEPKILKWNDAKKKSPKFTGEYIIAWDIDNDPPVTTMMEYDSKDKCWVDRQTKVDETNRVVAWMELPVITNKKFLEKVQN